MLTIEVKLKGGGCAGSKAAVGEPEQGGPPGAQLQLEAAEETTPAAAQSTSEGPVATAEAPAQAAEAPAAAAAESAASEVTTLAPADLTRYTEPASMWEALRTGHVRLLKMTWIIKLSKAGKVLARRQELPEEAFITVAELEELFGDGNYDGVLPIIAISFCWLTPAHPDPEGKQLEVVAAALEREQAKYASVSEWYGTSFKGFSEMGVFWDWASIYQMDPTLWRPFITGPEAKEEAEQTEEEREQTNAYWDSRTAEEQAAFRFALHNTMDLWYAHQGTTVYMLTKLPEGSTRKIGYSDSGWTTY